MKTPRVIIEVKGGTVRQVYSDAPVNVNVLDWDNVDAEDSLDAMEATREDCLKLEAETKTMKIAW